MTVVRWHEDPAEPGVLRPEEPVVLRSGDVLSVTTTVIDGVTMPWAEGEVTTR